MSVKLLPLSLCLPAPSLLPREAVGHPASTATTAMLSLATGMWWPITGGRRRREWDGCARCCPDVSLHPRCCNTPGRLQPSGGGAEEEMSQASLCPDASLQLCSAACSLQPRPAHGFLAISPLKAPAGISYAVGLSQLCQRHPEAKECDFR